MILSSTKYGTKRRLEIEGFGRFSVSSKFAEVLFYVQLIDNNGILLSDKSLWQNRQVNYVISNENYVDAQFNSVTEETEGALKEFDYFFQLMNQRNFTTPELIIKLAEKLDERGVFN